LDRGFHLILAGGGSSNRFGRDKLWIEIHGKPVLLHALAPFASHPGLLSGVVALSGEGLDAKGARLAPHLPPRFQIIPGGETRSLSVCRAFTALKADEDDLVVIHDAARPCLSPAVLNRLLALAHETGAVIAAVPVRDTLKVVNGDRVTGTSSRTDKVQEQTPLIFRASLLSEAYARPEAEWKDFTDEAQMLEAMGLPVYWGLGAPENLKLTYPEDLPLIEAILMSRL
jgi:2-C-methyl-D-erythritol 4-phosphate cytidylyltransferase